MNVEKRLENVLRTIVEELVDSPDKISVKATTSDDGRGNAIILTVRSGAGEMGQVIGRAGKNAHAMRLLLEAMAAKYKQRVYLEIDDGRS